MTPILFPKPISVKESKLDRVRRYQANRRRKATKRLKLTKKGTRKKRVKLPSIKKLVAKADAVFASYIRERDGNRCVLCTSTKNPTCGHLIKRGKKATRWDETNCNCLCMGCNYKDNFDHDVYVAWWINKYGADKYQELVLRSREMVKLTRELLTAIIIKYGSDRRGGVERSGNV